MRSIRVFLATSIVSTLILFNFVAALQGYQSSMREADTLFDNKMLDLARLVASLDVNDSAITSLRLGSDLAFQIWQDGELLASSSNAPKERLHDFIPGFDFANFNSYRWRTLAKFDAQRDRWVFVAERTDLRYFLAENVVLQSILPLLLGIPIVGGLVWVLVSRGLAPLALLSLELKRKPANDLSPIEFKESRIELEQMLASMNGFVSRLDAAMEREKRFSADAAHELRTPISALKVQLHNLTQSLDVDHAAYKELQGGIDRLQHLIEQLLSLYRTSPEQFDRTRSQVDLLSLSQAVVARLYPDFERKSQTIELEGNLGPDLAVVNGDKFALETLLANLLLNANRYTPEEGRIVVSISLHNAQVRLSVEDSGIGIQESDRTRIFERFTRLDEARTLDSGDEKPGCGLGLAIVSHVASLHDAAITIGRSRFSTGTSFVVDFPLANTSPREGRDCE